MGATGSLVTSYSLFIVGGWMRTARKASRTFWGQCYKAFLSVT
jgi:hypothetical protein